MRLLGLADFNGDKEALKRYYERCKKINEASDEFRKSYSVKKEDSSSDEKVTFTRLEGGKNCGTTTSLGFELKPGIEKFESGELPGDYYDNMCELER